MRESVPHAGDLLPLNVWRSTACLLGEILGCFTDHNEVKGYSVLDHGLRKKVLPAVLGVQGNSVDRLQEFLDIERLVLMRQREVSPLRGLDP